MHRIIAPAIVAIALLAASLGEPRTATAQDAVLAKLYGNGVHAYFAGDFVDAHKYLSAAVDAGTRDPRVFYFRGLTYQRLGREEMAVEDFQLGAELEMQDVNNFYPVAASLARVQGGQRMMVEDHRTEARLASYTKAAMERKARFGENATGDEPLPPRNIDPRDAAPIDPSDELFGDDEPAAGGTNPGVADPFADEPMGVPAGPEPMDDPAADPADPFGDVPADDPMTDPADPFGGGGAPGNAPAEPGVEDPFGGVPDPGAADPFGDTPMTDPAGGADPFGAGNDPAPDPFGGGPADPAQPADVDDPFAAPAPMPQDPAGGAPAGGGPAAGADKVDSKAIPGSLGRAFGRALFGGGDAAGGNDADGLERELDRERIGLEEGQPGADVPPGQVIPGAGGVVEGGLGDPFGDDPEQPGEDAAGGDAPDPFGGPADDGGADPFGAGDAPAAGGDDPFDNPF